MDAGSLAISQDPGVVAPINTTALDPNARIRAQVFANAGEGTIPCTDFWCDLPAYGAVYIATNVASSHTAYATIQFRRPVDHLSVYAEGHA